MWFKKKAPAASPGAAKAGPSISSLLQPETILILGPALAKDAVLESLVAAAAKAHGLGPAAALLAQVREREKGISTTLDSGLSLPHARLDGIEKTAAALALVPDGVSDAAQPQLRARAVFLFFSPNRAEAFPQHLQLLRAVATLFKPELIDALCALKSPVDILARLRAVEA